jgi:hypothetical protein
LIQNRPTEALEALADSLQRGRPSVEPGELLLDRRHNPFLFGGWGNRNGMSSKHGSSNRRKGSPSGLVLELPH